MLINRVRELRARHRWSQQDLAKKIGTKRQKIGLIEKGDHAPSRTLALKITKALQVTVEEVFSLNKVSYYSDIFIYSVSYFFYFFPV
ncbi:helix-turn-helix transcriptional regulator [Bacillus thuringiensis]|uniref:helix-turn-helix transcriptional regulator n=1 Tax=Bacillus thuringiensis TaxID=1428 RepID=UPI0021E97616|nr:helix-turn-helix transcriptional regulator [Bacillus thuringiensis]